MRLLLRRVFQEKRRFVIPVLGGLAVNILLYLVVVYPLSVRTRSSEAHAQTAEKTLRAAEREDADARGITAGRDRTDAALKAFYTDVLPPNLTLARQATFLRLSQLAEQHHLRRSRSDMVLDGEKNASVQRIRITMSLQGDYEDIRRFIYQVESGIDFIVIDSIALRGGADAGSPLTLDLILFTYYRARAGGA
ncbi:MAG TPA: GspMb/PilO family protein [Vicinamibacterales bacterium]|nr:GspMb/PilO family protein [Vicinamibacterales bacterium]